jgi:glucose-6-phosphate 1-dehydrogenase
VVPGDLNSRKIAPALYNLFLDGWMPKQFSIIGTGRTKLTDEQFRANLHNDINQFSRSGKTDDKKWAEFEKTSTTRYQMLPMPKLIKNLANVLMRITPNGKLKPTCCFTWR